MNHKGWWGFAALIEEEEKELIAHAQDFHYKRDKQFEYLSANIDRIPVVVSPYDAELFGHWWF
ncbi:MAG: hypothetical protein LRY22_00170, partial [Aliarcobacter cryaerophilus]|nr:hypothetical protein [Aliarcobacter cryaerophilus]